jgi:hypothetical protein
MADDLKPLPDPVDLVNRIYHEVRQLRINHPRKEQLVALDRLTQLTRDLRAHQTLHVVNEPPKPR